jgi:hypothetical protein
VTRGGRRAIWLSAAVLAFVAAACVPIGQTSAPPGPPDPRSGTGAWSAPVASGGTVMQHAVLIPGTSSVLFFEDGAGAKILNTSNGAITPEPAANNLFCAGQTVLADGRVFVLGGDAAGNPFYGSISTNIYNPFNGAFTPAANMNTVRWYPTGTRLPDGRVLATGGTKGGVIQVTPEIYNPGNNTWNYLAQSANLDVAYYPFMFVLPDGRLVEAGGFELTGHPVKTLNLFTQQWTTVDGRAIPVGSATMYRPGVILRAGTPGGPGTAAQVATNAAWVLDMNGGGQRQTSSMALPRAWLNLTTLPDGNVLATGGKRDHELGNAFGAAFAAEEWSPATGRWTTLASNAVPRFYHSVALLLPDGRVLVGGGWGGGPGGADVRQRTYEIFSPPYLFKGPRPSILSAPGTVGYGQGFTIATADAGRIASVAITAPGAVTHNFDENNRFVPLGFKVVPGGLQIGAPANGNWAPPGPYLLWIVDSNGVPSVARWITFR